MQHPRQLRESWVTAEQLVATRSGQRNGHSSLSCGAAYEIRVESVECGLVDRRQSIRELSQKVFFAQSHIGVAAADRRRHAGGVLRLVEAGLVEADRKGVYRARRGLAGERRHGARVNPAREKDSERRIRDELHADRVRQFMTQLVLGRAPYVGRGRPPITSQRVPVVAGVLRPPAWGDGEDTCRRQQLDSFDNGRGPDHEALGQVGGDTGRVQPALDDTAGKQRPDFGCEQKDLPAERAVPRSRPVQWLDPEVIAHQVHRARTRVPNSHRKDAAQARYDAEPPTAVRFEYHFRVGPRVELLPERLQLAPELSEVVDLTIEGDGAPGRSIHHRLSARLAQVDDRETAVAKHHFAGLRRPKSSAVGSPVLLRRADAFDAGGDRVTIRRYVESRGRKIAYGTGDSTHCCLVTSSAAAAALVCAGVWPRGHFRLTILAAAMRAQTAAGAPQPCGMPAAAQAPGVHLRLA